MNRNAYPWNSVVKSIVILLFASLSFAGCKRHSKTDVDGVNITDTTEKISFQKESTTSGTIKMGVDESLRPLGEALISSFEANFPDATLETEYMPEALMYKYLAEDSIRILIGCRDLSDKEKARILAENIKVRDYPIAHGAVVLLTNKRNPITQLTNEELKQVLSGSVSNWKDLGAEDFDKEINIVFDNPSSSVLRDLKNEYLGGGDLSSKAFAQKSTNKVVEYVSQQPSALGLIGFAWISDRDDPRVNTLLDSVNVMALEAPDSSDMPGEYFRAYQNEIMLKRYPLTRSIQIISREHFTGLGTGFAIFATSTQGQLIVLKSGMVPEKMPGRLINLVE